MSDEQFTSVCSDRIKRLTWWNEDRVGDHTPDSVASSSVASAFCGSEP